MDDAFGPLAVIRDVVAVARALALPSLWGALITAGLLAIAGWVSAWQFARLLNREYRMRLGHHALCAAAAVVTLVSVPVWAVASYVGSAAEAADRVWRAALTNDSEWQRETFSAAYAAVRRLGVEDFARVPPPGATDSRIPLTRAASVRAVSAIYASAAIAHFAEQFPGLRVLIGAPVANALEATLRSAFEHAGSVYPIERASRFVVAAVGDSVRDRVTWRVREAQALAIVLAVGAQALAFASAGVAAYRDIKVHV